MKFKFHSPQSLLAPHHTHSFPDRPGCLHTGRAGLNGYDRACLAHEAQNIYRLVLDTRPVPASALGAGRWGSAGAPQEIGADSRGSQEGGPPGKAVRLGSGSLPKPRPHHPGLPQAPSVPDILPREATKPGTQTWPGHEAGRKRLEAVMLPTARSRTHHNSGKDDRVPLQRGDTLGLPNLVQERA